MNDRTRSPWDLLTVLPQHRGPARRRSGASRGGHEAGGGRGGPRPPPEVGDPRAGRLDVAPASPALGSQEAAVSENSSGGPATGSAIVQQIAQSQ